MPALPLTTLLSWAWIAFAIEVDNTVEAAGAERVGRLFRISLAMWSNGLRLIDEEGIGFGELQARTGAACNIGGLERWGWIRVGDPSAGRRQGYGTQRGVKAETVLRPTRAGLHARRLWPRALAEVEGRWRARFGDLAVESVREALAPLGGGMPWAPPEVHPSDGFFTHVVQGPASDDSRELAVLLGGALTALTIDHEDGAPISLPVGANVMRVVDAGVVRTRDLPRLTGTSKEAVEMTTGYLVRHRLAEVSSEGAIRLTSRGLEGLAACRDRAARVQNEALRDSLERIVSRTDALAAGLVPPDGCWRGQRPYLAQTQRMLADPTAALPWQPMVLHRGGWPDGS
ncbi:MAG: hypothetical protein J2P45_12880 [Candidatus Dormibacteraeota bacterium]|nr:hypothetical protein [Candidatus Dormibacteraeota bacterium]